MKNLYGESEKDSILSERMMLFSSEDISEEKDVARANPDVVAQFQKIFREAHTSLKK